jgi:hypothetical protein
MSVPRKPATAKRRKIGSSKMPTTSAHPSLALSPSLADRRAELEKRLAEQDIEPIPDFDKFMEETRDFWPEDETCDQFLAWLRQARREGRT